MERSIDIGGTLLVETLPSHRAVGVNHDKIASPATTSGRFHHAYAITFNSYSIIEPSNFIHSSSTQWVNHSTERGTVKPRRKCKQNESSQNASNSDSTMARECVAIDIIRCQRPNGRCRYMESPSSNYEKSHFVFTGNTKRTLHVLLRL